MEKKVLILGGKGMLGHMLVSYINSLKDYKVYYTLRKEINLKKQEIFFDAYKNLEEINEIIKKIKPILIVNCIGIIKPFVNNNKEKVVFLNSYFPHKINKICIEKNIKFIHISTDCVFSGKKGAYTEESLYSPKDFYGLSKATGEINNKHNLTIRTSIIGPELKKSGVSLMNWLFQQKNNKIKGFKKAIWSGLTTLELSKKIVEMYEKKVTGLINITSKPINKYNLLKIINEVYKLNINIDPNNSFYCDRSMKSIRDDIKYNVPSHNQMIIELKNWTESKKII